MIMIIIVIITTFIVAIANAMIKKNVHAMWPNALRLIAICMLLVQSEWIALQMWIIRVEWVRRTHTVFICEGGFVSGRSVESIKPNSLIIIFHRVCGKNNEMNELKEEEKDKLRKIYCDDN